MAETPRRRSREAAPKPDAPAANAAHRVEPVAPAGPTEPVDPAGSGHTVESSEPAGPAESAESLAAPAPAAHGHKYRRRALSQPGGGRLVLTTDGTVLLLGADGSREHAWATDDPEWSRMAIRFGLHVESTTISPAGRFVEDTRPPRIGG